MAVLSNFGIPVGSSTVQTLMPKLQYRFRVTFTGLGIATNQLVTQNVISATRPSVDHEDVTIDTYNSKIRLAGKHMWQDVTVVLRDDTNNHVILAIRDQMNKQVNYATQESANAGTDYKFSMKIETLDGSQGAGDAPVIDSWELDGCFLPNTTFGDLNYATSDVVQVSMTVRYDQATLTPFGGHSNAATTV